MLPTYLSSSVRLVVFFSEMIDGLFYLRSSIFSTDYNQLSETRSSVTFLTLLYDFTVYFWIHVVSDYTWISNQLNHKFALARFHFWIIYFLTYRPTVSLFRNSKPHGYASVDLNIKAA